MAAPTLRSILRTLTVARLRELCVAYDTAPGSRARKEQLVRALASRRRSMVDVLSRLTLAELKAACRGHDKDDRGRAKRALIRRLVPAPVLERALLDAPPGAPEFRLRAAALREQGDPRAELMDLTRAGARLDARDTRRLARLVARHPAWTKGAERLFDVRFVDGYVGSMVIPTEAVAREMEDKDGYPDEPDPALLRDPSSARLRRLSTETMLSAEGNHGCWGSQEETVAALLSRPRPQLRIVEFDRWMQSSTDVGPRLSHRLKRVMHEAEIKFGDLSRLWTIAPRLETLVIAQGESRRGQCSLGTIVAPELRTLCLGLMPTMRSHLESLARARTPKLRHLELRMVAELWRDDKIHAPSLLAALNSAGLRRLEHLGLLGHVPQQGDEHDADFYDNDVYRTRGLREGDTVVNTLVASRLLFRLRSLDLGGIRASDRVWRMLVNAAPPLETLYLARCVPPEQASMLEAAFPVVWRAPERTDLDDQGDDWDRAI